VFIQFGLSHSNGGAVTTESLAIILLSFSLLIPIYGQKIMEAEQKSVKYYR
jgi:hypothetical protein